MIKLPFGQTTDGRMVTASAVERGLLCHCQCPKCLGALVACQGEIVRDYFRHHVEPDDCRGARETALHLYAKQLICRSLLLTLPDSHQLGTLKRARAEVWLDGVQPDVLADFTEPVAVEIFVAHRAPVDKIKVYVQRKLAAIEIDLHDYRFVDEAEWDDLILHKAERRWLCYPAVLRKTFEEQQRAILDGVRQRIDGAISAMREAEARRIDYEKSYKNLELTTEMRQTLNAVRWEEWTRQREVKDLQVELEWLVKKLPQAEMRQALAAFLHHNKQGPNLQALVEAHGAYSAISAEAWETFDREIEHWKTRIRSSSYELETL